MTVREQQGWVRHETKGESGMTHVQTPFYRHLSHACMCTRMKMCKCDCARAMCRKMCVQQVSVCTHTRRTHCNRYYMCTKPSKNSVKKPLSRKNIDIHHSTTILTTKIFNSSSGFGTLLKTQTSSFHVRLDLSY